MNNKVIRSDLVTNNQHVEVKADEIEKARCNYTKHLVAESNSSLITMRDDALISIQRQQKIEERIKATNLLDRLEEIALQEAITWILDRGLRTVMFDLIVPGRNAPRRCALYDTTVAADIFGGEPIYLGGEFTRQRSKAMSPDFVMTLNSGDGPIESLISIKVAAEHCVKTESTGKKE